MQVNVTAEGLKRRMTVEVPADKVEDEVRQRLKSLMGRVRIDGFRPGKVPFKVVERRYGGSVRQEVRGDLLQSSFVDAIAREKLRPAGTPQLEVGESGSGLSYTAEFEVYPEFEVKLPGDTVVEKPVVDISEADVDAMIDKLRQQRKRWEAVARPAENGDQLVLDFEGTIDGQPFPGNAAKGYAVVLGSRALIADFEDRLLGMTAGQDTEFEIAFPDDYHVKDLAGKTARFEVKVLSVAEGRVPEVDEAFIASFGVNEGGVAALRDEVKASMAREKEQAVRERVKQQVMDALLQNNPFEVPNSLITEEVSRLNPPPAGSGSAPPEPGPEVAEKARKRVALGLIVSELVRTHGFKAAPGAVRAKVEDAASTYDQPEEVVKWYYSDRSRLKSVEAAVLEDQAVDWALAQIQVKEVPVSFDDLMGKPQNNPASSA
ncbi:MAG TPA: trigger factor [Gammaproteobacteria bacterium]|nr:trigger factor [Gammaproteobacteria bacterium]